MQNYPNQRDVHKTNFDGSDNIKTNFQSTPFFANNSHKAVILEWTGNDEISYFLFNFETTEKNYLFKTHSRMSLLDISFSWDDSLLFVYNEPLIYYSFKDSTLYENDFSIFSSDRSPITWGKENDKLIVLYDNIIYTYSTSKHNYDTLVVATGYDDIFSFSYNPNTDLLAYAYEKEDTNNVYTLNLTDSIQQTVFTASCIECYSGPIMKMSWNIKENLLSFTSKPFIDPHVENFYLYNSNVDTSFQYVRGNDGYTYQLKWLDKDKIAYMNASNSYQLFCYQYDEPLTVKKSKIETLNISLGCYPNPFNSEAIIEFTIPSRSNISVTIYNILGQKVKELINENKLKGTYQIKWDGKDYTNSIITSGVYLIRLLAKDEDDITKQKTIKLLNLK